MSDVSNAILEKSKYEKDLTEYCHNMLKSCNKERLNYFGTLRAFDQSTVDRCEIFYVGDMTDMLIPSHFDRIDQLGIISPTNLKPIFRERWVIPIKTPENLVQGLVGYSPYANERYIYGTSKYYRRRATLYGLENLEMAYDMGYAFVTEGITDTIRLRDMGFLNSFAMCGTHSSEFVIKQLNRCRNGVILIPDRDDAGLGALKNWTFNRSITIFINLRYKDLDEMCVIRKPDSDIRVKDEDNISWFKECAQHCIDWVLSETHDGKLSTREKITMI